MTKEKTLSAQEKGKLNAKKISDWLKTEPAIPIFQQKINKTAICRMHQIPKSTIETNPDLRDLFAKGGPIEKLAAKQKKLLSENSEHANSETSPDSTPEATEELKEKIDALQRRLDSITLDLASEEFLISTGRYIPKLYSGQGNS
jgi:hypothetical protein